MLSETDKDTLKDGVHAVISGQAVNTPFDVEWIRRRVVNRGGVSAQISNAEDAPSVIEETMGEILTLGAAFPNVTETDPDFRGVRRWIILAAG
jgi:hypothetical protein